jgi:tRNA(Leu) C34 or U34 (ribose-2'-O)-methylase TrmL
MKPHVIIGLINPKSPDNVCSVMRAAGNYGVDSISYTGQRYPRALTLNPETPNLQRRISDNIAVNGVTSLTTRITENLKIVCIEFAENATSLPEFVHPEHVCYIFGPEDGSIDQEVIDEADAVVYVPTQSCMNLAATVNVVLYDRLAKSFKGGDDNALIFQNRDKNNNLKVINK